MLIYFIFTANYIDIEAMVDDFISFFVGGI